MSQPALRRALAFSIAAGLAACGSVSVAPQEDAGPAASDAGAPPPQVDAGEAGTGECDDPTVCSRVQGHGGCSGVTKAGDFCDFLVTPCSATPPDCAMVGAIAGGSATLETCGDGLSFCMVNWAGTVDAAELGKLCAARDATMAPLDCLED